MGVFSPPDGQARLGARIGDWIIDLAAAALQILLPEPIRGPLQRQTLNDVFALEAEDRLALRHALFALLTDDWRRAAIEPALYPADDCIMHLPAAVGDYTDFYVGIHHANNIGSLFRPDNPLLPNYKHVPIGYHGRASSIRVSGHEVVRPKGQRKLPDADAPDFGPSRRLDYELELGVWIAGSNDLGNPVPITEAPSRIAGYCLLNDWSARDMQAWEYQPLGPFLAKNFLTSLSPWVITAEAMAPFMVSQSVRPHDDPKPLPYLWDEADQSRGALSIELEVHIASQQMRESGLPPHRLSQGPAKNMYWTVAQMIAHHTSNGCDLKPGDLLGTGTISGPEPDSYGSLMELSQGGKQPITLPSGEARTFLEGGDELILSAHARAAGFRSIGFGSCIGTVTNAR
jgi:fumarylacetoacetase